MSTHTTYSTIVYMQGDEGYDALDILDELGLDALADYLMQWDYGEDHDVRDEAPWGSGYRTHTFTQGGLTYVVAYDFRLGAVSLTRVIVERWDGEGEGYGSCGVMGCTDCK